MSDQLIVSADDLGLSQGNIQTIFQSVDNGAITSVSILANGYAFDDAIQEYQARREKLRIAVHLNLTEGKALLPHEEIPLITDIEGNFKYSPPKLWGLYLLSSQKDKKALRDQVMKEYRAQIEKVREALGLTNEPIAVDGHQHAHMVPFVFTVIATLAPELHIHEVRIPDEPIYIASVAFSASGPQHIIATVLFSLLSFRMRRVAARAGMRTNDSFIGLLFSGYVCKETAEAGLRAVVNRRSALTEILFHPGSCTGGELVQWKGNTEWHYDQKRVTERAYVMSDDAKKLFTEFRNGTLAAGPDLPKIFRYLVAGSLAAFTHLGGLYLFTEHTHIWYVYANVLAFGMGLVVSFILQKFWTFADHSTDKVHHQALIYTAMQVVSLGINTGGLYLLVQYVHMWYLLAEFILLIVVAGGNFFISNAVIFKKHGGH